MNVKTKLAGAAVAGCLAVSIAPTIAMAEEVAPEESSTTIEKSTDGGAAALVGDDISGVNAPNDANGADGANGDDVSNGEVNTTDADVSDGADAADSMKQSRLLDSIVEDDDPEDPEYDAMEGLRPETSYDENDQLVVHPIEHGNVHLTYTSIDTGLGLPGAIFNLVDMDGNIIQTAITDEKGILIFKDIPLGQKFDIIEAQAPKGYASVNHGEVVRISISNNGEEWLDSMKPTVTKQGYDTETWQLKVTQEDLDELGGRYYFYFGTRAQRYPNVPIAQLGQTITVKVSAVDDEGDVVEITKVGALKGGNVNTSVYYVEEPCEITGMFLIKNQDQKPGGRIPLPYALNYELQMSHFHGGTVFLKVAGLTVEEAKEWDDVHHVDDPVVDEDELLGDYDPFAEDESANDNGDNSANEVDANDDVDSQAQEGSAINGETVQASVEAGNSPSTGDNAQGVFGLIVAAILGAVGAFASRSKRNDF